MVTAFAITAYPEAVEEFIKGLGAWRSAALGLKGTANSLEDITALPKNEIHASGPTSTIPSPRS